LYVLYLSFYPEISYLPPLGKTFDDDADGYCRGEGVVTFVIKRYEDAMADNDPIVACILSAYTNHSAEAESITRPHVGAQREIFQKVINSACIEADSIGYVEMHGTGTQAGDAREMESVLTTFTGLGSKKSRPDPLYLGSAKSNIGHGESVSGAIAMVKVLMMLEKNLIPPHCGIKNKVKSFIRYRIIGFDSNYYRSTPNSPQTWLSATCTLP
jgi:acyl transferase domain-containing protein